MPDPTPYTPPAIWQWNKENGGQFASINRPIAGPTHDKELPVGKHPLQLYSLGTPNGVKVTVMLEELLALGHSGAEYDAWLIRINEGEQFGSGFVSVNPNSKIPALLDRTDPSNPVRVFESGAILMYLAEKFGSAFLPKDGAARAECLSWLFWQMGSAPFVGGGFGHFYAYAPVKIEYAIDRYAMETKRQLDVLNQRLAVTEYVAGNEYTVADMAIWPWYGLMVKGEAYDAGEFLQVHEYTHVLRWAEQVGQRRAVIGQKGAAKLLGQVHQDGAGLEHAHGVGGIGAVQQRGDFGVGVHRHKPAAKLLALVDANQPRVVLCPAVAQRQQLFQHHGHLHAIGRGQRIQLQRMPPHGQFLVVRGTGDGPVDAGELAAVFFVPLPDGGRGVGGGGKHERLPKKRKVAGSPNWCGKV